MLTSWSAPTADQERLRRRYLDHLAATATGWSRNSPVAHLTASALITDAEVHHVLLVRHAKLGRWLQTGGHLEPDDEDLAAAAAREATEESGLAVRIDPLPLLLSEHPAPCRPRCQHLDVQFHAVAERSTPQVSAESTAVAWFGIESLPETDDTVRALVAAARQGARVGY